MVRRKENSQNAFAGHGDEPAAPGAALAGIGVILCGTGSDGALELPAQTGHDFSPDKKRTLPITQLTGTDRRVSDAVPQAQG